MRGSDGGQKPYVGVKGEINFYILLICWLGVTNKKSIDATAKGIFIEKEEKCYSSHKVVRFDGVPLIYRTDNQYLGFFFQI